MLIIWFTCSLSLLFLISLNLSNNTFNIIGMFYKCSSLTSVNLSNFNANKVYDMICMFLNYYIIDSPYFVIINIFNISSNMFHNFSSITILNLTNFNQINLFI